MPHKNITVESPAGTFEGIRGEGLAKFLGIRYAAAPVGEKRFLPPQPYRGGGDVHDATRYGNRHFQYGWPEDVMAELEPQGEESEDCLFLNVFAPEASETPKPVLVWIHGGAFICGSGNDYDPSNIVKQNDVLVVSINYRLGIFGFLNLAPIGSEYAGSANLGIQDQIAALRWVQDNIAAFGGDAGNVTIWGESAGAASVLALLAAPMAEGLFHKAMVFSGAETLTPPGNGLGEIAAFMGCTSEQECFDRLKAMPAKELSLLQVQSGIYIGPCVDGVVLTRASCEAIKDGGASTIPVLAGTTRDEGTILAPGFMATDAIGAAVVFGLSCSIGRDDGSNYQQFLTQQYGADELYQHMNRAWFDVFRASALRVAATATAHGAGGWVYNFELETDHALGIAHFADVPFTFNWLEEGNPGVFVHPPSDINCKLAEYWSKTMITFAKTGSPNGAGLPEWPKYQSGDFQCLWFAQQPDIVANPDADMVNLYRVAETAL